MLPNFKTVQLLAFTALLITLTACNGGGSVKHYDELPQTAQTFINQYCVQNDIQSIEKDWDHGALSFTVQFSSGYEVEFDAQGDWTQIESKDNKPLPEKLQGAFKPGILLYLKEAFPQKWVTDLQKQPAGGFKVEINTQSDLDLYFDNDGTFVRLTDD